MTVEIKRSKLQIGNFNLHDPEWPIIHGKLKQTVLSKSNVYTISETDTH